MIKNLLFFSIIFLNTLFYLFFQKIEIHDEVKIIIKPGNQLNQISDVLYENGLIQDRFLFKLWVKINSSEKKLKFGEYLFEKKVSLNSILKKLKDGKSVNRKITIVEGSTKSDLLSILNNLNQDVTLKYEEIPNQIIANTYFYHVTDNPKQILKSIEAKSNYIASKIWDERDKTIPIKNIEELFIISSIVEKETFLQEERSLISGVFYNRFSKNMKLQSDPTVVYALTLGKKKLGRKLLRKDLKFKSEYNTYVNKGLPPSPICIPGVQSLISASKPQHNPYLYFVSKNKKNEGHLFSVNYKDHLKKIKSIKEKKKEHE